MRFSFTLSALYKLLIKVMGISSKVEQVVKPQLELHLLSKQEYELLFKILKETWIKGEDIQVMYGTIHKLQEQYISHYGNK